MKKFASLFLALTMVLSLAACGNGGENETTAPVGTTLPNETTVTNETTETENNDTTATGTLAVLQNIWAGYTEDEKFPIAGGNIETGIMGEPGAWDMAYAENMTYNLLVPAEQLSSIVEAASMIHMMNANTFTCGAFKLAEGTDAAAFAAAMQAAVQGNQWMCGFPETLVIAVVDGYVVMAFGINDVMTPFQTHLTGAYANAEVLYNEAIAG